MQKKNHLAKRLKTNLIDSDVGFFVKIIFCKYLIHLLWYVVLISSSQYQDEILNMRDLDKVEFFKRNLTSF